MDDPLSISADSWFEIGQWLHALWIFFFATIVFGMSLLIGHAFIPSLVSTGELPQRFMKMRRVFSAVAVVAFVVAIVFLSIGIARTELLGDIYDRWWI